MSRIMITLNPYDKNLWKDYLLQDKDKRSIVKNDDDTFNITIPSENILQEGSVFTADRMNNIEDGIGHLYIVVAEILRALKLHDIYIDILLARFDNNTSGAIVVTFEEKDEVLINRGIYDETNKLVFAENEEGIRTELRSFGAAMR